MQHLYTKTQSQGPTKWLHKQHHYYSKLYTDRTKRTWFYAPLGGRLGLLSFSFTNFTDRSLAYNNGTLWATGNRLLLVALLLHRKQQTTALCLRYFLRWFFASSLVWLACIHINLIFNEHFKTENNIKSARLRLYRDGHQPAIVINRKPTRPCSHNKSCHHQIPTKCVKIIIDTRRSDRKQQTKKQKKIISTLQVRISASANYKTGTWPVTDWHRFMWTHRKCFYFLWPALGSRFFSRSLWHPDMRY